MHILETERQVASFLSEAALALADRENEEIVITSFATAGVMSVNQGFVLRAGASASPQFQIIVIRSH